MKRDQESRANRIGKEVFDFLNRTEKDPASREKGIGKEVFDLLNQDLAHADDTQLLLLATEVLQSKHRDALASTILAYRRALKDEIELTRTKETLSANEKRLSEIDSRITEITAQITKVENHG